MEFCEIETSTQFLVLKLKGKWRLVNFTQIKAALQDLPKGLRGVVLNGSLLTELDTASSMVVLNAIADAGYRSDMLQLDQFQSTHQAILTLAANAIKTPHQLKRSNTLPFVAQFGKDSIEVYKLILDVVSFTGLTMYEFCRAAIEPRKLRLKELSVQLENVGLRAIPIVTLMTFLIGIVIAYLTGIQIQKYGANIFIVDAVAVAMCRELSPILTAIIVAGRSGSSFTAQIGTMKLNEEIDALQTMGLSTVRVLVMPRLIALIVAMPLLVFLGDISGILGGMVIAQTQLEITGATFIERLHTQLTPKTIIVGLIKAPVFGFFIATIACRLGLQTENNARSVGINTTRTVVRSIVAVILLNAAFAIIFNELGI